MGNGSPSWLPASRNATATHTFAANAQKVIERYPFNEQSGYFGERGSRGDVRRIECDSPIKQAHDFFSLVAEGGRLSDLPGGKGWRVDLKDGTVVTLRDTSSDGSPSMQLGISREYDGRVKSQKIHFIQK